MGGTVKKRRDPNIIYKESYDTEDLWGHTLKELKPEISALGWELINFPMHEEEKGLGVWVTLWQQMFMSFEGAQEVANETVKLCQR